MMKTIKLTSACHIVTGKLDSNAAVENGKYPYFTCAPEPLRIDNYAFVENAILLAGNNASGNFHCQRYDGKFNAYQRTYIITAKQGYDIDFIYYSLLINLQLFRRIAQGSQTKFLTMEILDGFEVDDLTYREQMRLAKVLKDIDFKITNNNDICSDLEGMAKLLYDYWFVQFDFPDENGKPYKSSGGKMVWNEELKREIPEGWEVRNILDVCDIVDCLHSKKPDYCYEEEDAYLLTLENLTKGGLIDLTKKFYISKQDYEVWTSRIEVHEGDFVVTNAGRAGDIGRIPKYVKCAIGRNLTAIRPNKIESVYLHMFLHSFYFKAQIMNSLDQGSFFMSFNVHAIKKIKVLVPSKVVMEKTLETFTNIVEHVERLNEENQQLASLRDFLLPMLMNGQVSIRDNR